MIRQSLALVIADVSRKGLLAITVIVCARLLTTTMFGEYMFLISFYQIFSVLAGAGVPYTCVREVAVNGWARGGLVLGSVSVRVIFSLAVGALAVVFILVVGYPWTLLLAVPLMIGLMILRGATENIMAIFQGVDRQIRCVQIAVVQAAVTLAATLIICLNKPTVTLLFGAHLVGAAASSLLGFILLWLDDYSIATPWSTLKARIRELFKDSHWMNVGTFVSSAYNRCDVLILRRFWTAEIVGLYSAPYRLFDLTQILPTAIMGVLLPRLCNAKSVSKDVDTTDVLRVLLLIAMSIVITVTVFSGFFLPLVVGNKYKSSVPLLQILVWAVLPMYWNILVNTRLIAHRAERFLTLSAVIALLVNVGLNIIVIPRYGAFGASITTVITECVLLATNLFSLSRLEAWQLPKANGRIVAAVIAIAVFCTIWCTAGAPRLLALVILVAAIVLAPVRRADLVHLGIPLRVGR
jgi:O-antigen/teichoic acid export membrane protein